MIIKMRKILIIGAGNLGTAIAKNLTKYNQPFHMIEKCKINANSVRNSGLPVSNNISDIDITQYTPILCVKPKDLPSLKNQINSPKNLISALAGVSTKTLQSAFPDTNIARVMPNLGIAKGKSDTVYFCENPILAQFSKQLFSLGGSPIRVRSDHEIDIATGIVGTSPALLLYVRDILAQSATDHDIPRILSLQLANAAIKASGAIVEDHNMISKISSRGGTTEVALNILKQYPVDTAFKSSLKEAFGRCKDLDYEVFEKL
jgi:pyrroline-5-carboxylate reductase